MDIQKPYVFYDQYGNLWECEFGSCDILPNPQNMWNGIAQRINLEEMQNDPHEKNVKVKTNQ